MAQVPVRCRLCDSEDEVDFYCVTCGEVLCKRCKETHLRSRKTKNDEIVALSEARQQQPVKISPFNYCNEHPALEFSLYCNQCDEFICLECLDGKHYDHKSQVLTLTKFTNLKKEKLVTAKKLLINKRSRFDKPINTEGEIHKNFSLCVEKCKNNITDQKSKIVKELDNVCEERFSELASLQRNEDDRHSKSCLDIQSQRQEVVLALQSVENGVESEDPAVILQATKDSTQTIQRLKESIPPQLSVPNFIPQKVRNQGISNQLGTLFKENQDNRPDRQFMNKGGKENATSITSTGSTNKERVKKKQIQVMQSVQSFRIPNKYVVRVIIPMENNTVWVVADEDRHLSLITTIPEIIQESVNFEGNIVDAVRYNKCLLVTYSSCVMKMSSNGKLTSMFADFSEQDYWTRGLCVTHDMDVLVCLHSSTEIGKVVRLNEIGDVIQSIQEDHTGASLFTLPDRVTSLPTGDILVTDPPILRILLLDKQGRLLFTWNKDITSHYFSYHRCNITSDKYGSLFIIYSQDLDIHALNMEKTGENATTRIFTSDTGISTIALNSEYLYIGGTCGNGAGVIKYKIEYY